MPKKHFFDVRIFVSAKALEHFSKGYFKYVQHRLSQEDYYQKKASERYIKYILYIWGWKQLCYLISIRMVYCVLPSMVQGIFKCICFYCSVLTVLYIYICIRAHTFFRCNSNAGCILPACLQAPFSGRRVRAPGAGAGRRSKLSPGPRFLQHCNP